MKVVVDTDLCQGHAMCELEAPEVFTVPKNGTVRVLTTDPPTELHAAVRLAVQYCPTRAISLEESDG
jgi:ferredoxin